MKFHRRSHITSQNLLSPFLKQLNQCNQWSDLAGLYTAVFWLEVWAVFGAAVWVTDWAPGTWVWLRPLDTGRMKDITWCWQIVTFLVSCEQDNDHFLLMPWKVGPRAGIKCDKELFSALLHCLFFSMSDRGSEQVKQKPGWNLNLKVISRLNISTKINK